MINEKQKYLCINEDCNFTRITTEFSDKCSCGSERITTQEFRKRIRAKRSL